MKKYTHKTFRANSETFGAIAPNVLASRRHCFYPALPRQKSKGTLAHLRHSSCVNDSKLVYLFGKCVHKLIEKKITNKFTFISPYHDTLCKPREGAVEALFSNCVTPVK